MWRWFFTRFTSWWQALSFFVKALFFLVSWSYAYSAAYVSIFGMRALSGFISPDTSSLIGGPAKAMTVAHAAGRFAKAFSEEVTRVFFLFLLVVILEAILKKSRHVLPIAVIASAVAFGAIHMTNGLPLSFVLGVQGISGFVFNAAFFKACGPRISRFRNILVGLCFSAALHASLNISIDCIRLMAAHHS